MVCQSRGCGWLLAPVPSGTSSGALERQHKGSGCSPRAGGRGIGLTQWDGAAGEPGLGICSTCAGVWLQVPSLGREGGSVEDAGTASLLGSLFPGRCCRSAAIGSFAAARGPF